MNKFLLKKIKRSAALLLSTTIAVTTIPVGITTHAAQVDGPYLTELEPNVNLMDGRPTTAYTNSHYYNPSSKRLGKAASYGNGSTTAYKYGFIKQGASGFNGWKFDINGITQSVSEEPNSEDGEAYVISDSAGALSTTYPTSDPQGYTMAIGFGANAPSSTIDLGRINVKRSEVPVSTPDTFYPGKDGEIRNGEVVKVYDDSNTDLKLEVRLSIKPSPDKKYILAEYTVHNTNTETGNSNNKIVDPGRTDGGRTVWFATGTDTMVSGDDSAAAWSTAKTGMGNRIEGIHGQSRHKGGNGHTSSYTDDPDKWKLGSFDLLSYHPQLNLGIRKRDNTDPSKVTTWIGRYTEYSSNYYTDQTEVSYIQGIEGTPQKKGRTDTGLAYSLRFDLLPGETKTGTLAFSMRGPTYYVDPIGGSDTTGTGFITEPYKTIKRAVQDINRSNSPSKVFIFVTGDVTLGETIDIPAGKDITISTTDYYADSNSLTGVTAYPIIVDGNKQRTNQYTIKRDANFKGELFTVNHDNSTLTFSDIIIDGNKAETSVKPKNEQPIGALVKATAGNVLTQTGSIFQNNQIVPIGETFVDNQPENGVWDEGENFTDSNNNQKYDSVINGVVASAIDISGSANLKMDSGVVKDNISYQGGAVNIEGTGKMYAANYMTIDGNLNDAGGKSNVRLGSGKTVNVTEGLKGGSKIGISTVQTPATATDEIPVAEPSGIHAALPYAVSQFPADKTPAQWTQMGTAGNTRNVVLKASQAAYSVSYVYEVKNEMGVVTAENSIKNAINQNNMSGTSIHEVPPNIPNYVFNRVEISPTTNHGLSVDNVSGSIIGSMPGLDISIKYIYTRDVGIAYFFSDGGTPANIAPIESPSGGAPSGSMPVVSRTGYRFDGWFEITGKGIDNTYNTPDDVLDSIRTVSLPNPVVRGEKYYKAKWTLDGTGRLFETTHKNSNPSLPLIFNIIPDAKAYLDVVRTDQHPIPGYIYSTASANPSNKGAFGQVYDGLTNTTPTEYVGRMPLGEQKVNYIYRVDPSVTFAYKVEFITTGGSDLGNGIHTRRVAEAPISASPRTVPGYTLDSVRITDGNVAAPYVVTVTDTSGANPFDVDKNFNGRMPNQDVTITYIYRSNGGYELARRYIDTTSNQPIGRATVQNYAESAAVSEPMARKYGYTYDSTTLNPASAVIMVGAAGELTGAMPPNDIQAIHNMNRDLAYWKNLTFAVANAPYDKGTVESISPIQFLTDDPNTAEVESEAHTFGLIQAQNTLPVTTGNPAPYYKFVGWYLDAAATQPVTDSTVFQGDATVYAKFDEDPDFWIDVNFDTSGNGSISSITPVHTWKDHTWADITNERPVPVTPNTTPNYEFDKWTIGREQVVDNTVLINGATYTANFKKIASVWGLNVGDYTPTGRVGSDGSGEIKVGETQTNNVYVVSDMNGNIVAVMQAPSDGILNFTDLFPGTRYNVQEGTPDTVAVVGQPISSITGSAVSTPKEVLIPTVEDNYSVGVDPIYEGMAQIIINPADPDSDYALIDENGNIVTYPESDNGWMTPIGNTPKTVTFNNLNPGETYRVVARRKGDVSTSPLDKINEGTDINANPGDMVEARKFIVETKGDISSEVITVNGNIINLARFEEAKIGDTIVVKTDPVNTTGQSFKYWKVLAGRNSNIQGRINTTEFSFKMESSNVVLRAVYERDSSIVPSNANSEEEIRGGAVGEFGLNPEDIFGLEDALTTPDDEVLMDINGADVTYKIVFNKRNAKANEVNEVKNVSSVFTNHPTAFSAAWALDVNAERYVNGRLVSRATPSDATTRAIVQLPNEDTDMLDYELWDVTDPQLPTEITIPINPEETAGLFSFESKIGHTYVLVYSKTFKLRFIDNNPVLDFEHLNDTNRNYYHMLKVRRGEAPTDTYYSGPTLWGDIESYKFSKLNDGETRLVSDGISKVVNFTDIYGIDYSFVDWSKRNMPDKISIFNPDAPIIRSMTLYAYYEDNRQDVEEARTKLTSLITEGDTLRTNPYLLADEITLLDDALAKARARIMQKRGELLAYDFGNGFIDPMRMAIYKELKAAIDELEDLMRTLNDNINNRMQRLINYTGGSAGGGGGSAGKGTGSKERPLEFAKEKVFSLGVDGSWQMNQYTKKWSFVLNGGLPLNNAWGKIQYADVNGKLLTKWYFFDNQASMVTGWYHENRVDKWYYLDPTSGISNGQMVTGWLKEPNSNHWYYLDPVVGEMYSGWHRIGEKWYYFSPNSVEGYPKGALYLNTVTPDGYQVNHDGEWIQ